MKKAIALAGFFAIASPLLAQIPDNAFFEGPHYKQETERTQPIAPAPAKSEPRKEVKPITAKGEKPAQPTENIVFLKPVQLSSSGYTQLSGEENSERLIKFLEHENPQLRAEAALELGKRQYLAAVPVLINMLTDDSKIVSDAAETALAGYREKSVTAVLTDKLYDGDEKLEGRIIDTLGTRNDPQSFDVIVRTLRKGSEACKVKAALALSKMGNTEACDSLIRIAERPDDFEPELVKTACFSLGRLYCPRAIPALIRISGSPDPDFRFAAVNSFKEMKNKAAFDALVARLDDPAEYVRLETIEALLTLKDPNLAEKLAPLIKSKNDRVAGGAAAVLSKLNTEQSHNAIKKLDELKYRDQVIEKEKDSADQIDDASKNIVPVY